MDLQTESKSFRGSSAEAGQRVNPDCTLLLNIMTYPDKFNLRKIRKATEYLAKYIPLHQVWGLGSQTVIILLDIIHKNDAYNSRKGSTLMRQLLGFSLNRRRKDG